MTETLTIMPFIHPFGNILLIQKKKGNHRAFLISAVSSAIGIFLFSQVYLRKLTDSVHSEVLYLCIRSSKPSWEVSGQDTIMVESTAMNVLGR